METKDLMLIIAMPLLIIGLLFYAGKSSITGAAVSEQQNPKAIGSYSVMPSFKVSTDYNLGEYKSLHTSLKELVETCKPRNDFEQCAKSESELEKRKWACDDDNYVLSYFADSLTDCINLDYEKVVCKFQFEDNPSINKNNRDARTFEIKLTNWYQRVKAELYESGNLLETQYINTEFISLVTDSEKRDDVIRADSITIKILYKLGKPSIPEAYSLKENGEKITINSGFLLYKSGNKISFIDNTIENFFSTSPPNTIIDIPSTRGMKFCAKSESSDLIYKFAITFPRSPTGPISGFSAADAKNSQNSLLLQWPYDKTAVFYNLYFSGKNFVDIKMQDIKKDSEIKSANIPATSTAEIENVDLSSCSVNYGQLCSYKDFGILEHNKLYRYKGKMIYILDGMKDNAATYIAITSADNGGQELDNDRSIEGNTLILQSGKNYISANSVDDLAPAKAGNFVLDQADNKARLRFEKPKISIDGTLADDVSGFVAYYKQTVSNLPANLDVGYTRKQISLSDANCVLDDKCEYNIVLEKGKSYNAAITAIDSSGNEYLRDVDTKPIIIQ